MLLLGFLLFVDALQVLDQVVDLRNIEELADDIGRLNVAESKDVLFDRAGKVSL